MDVQRMTVGMADCLVQRVSYTGDLGYEIYCDLMSQRQLCGTRSGTPARTSGSRPFGMRAMMSLRLDKFFGSWVREFSPDYTPAETGLDRFIRWNKPADFIGKAAALKEKAEGADAPALHLRRRRRRRRRRRLRADLARRRGGGLLHLGRLFALDREVGGDGVPAGGHGQGRAGGRDRDPRRDAARGSGDHAAVGRRRRADAGLRRIRKRSGGPFPRRTPEAKAEGRIGLRETWSTYPESRRANAAGQLLTAPPLLRPSAVSPCPHAAQDRSTVAGSSLSPCLSASPSPAASGRRKRRSNCRPPPAPG